ncbi:MAG: 2-oxo acid dehydrogenase subunit E2 [Acidobacteria bacterium]|nr:2-oxo acid dehydrogenase subunit E2 [Acidobacteriota bacterium]
MADFKVPELGENITTGDVTRVLVNVGDTIAREQPVIELETDKATIEVPSSVAGKVTDIKVRAGDKVKVGAVILTVEEEGAEEPQAKPEEQPAPEEKPKAEEKPRAEKPRAESARAEEAREEKPAAEPREEEIGPKEEEPREQKVVSMPRPARAEAARAAEPARGPRAVGPLPPPPAPPEREPAAPAAPSVRRLAREIGVDVNEVQGTGPGGRISQDDVKEHARRILSSVGPSTLLGAGTGAAGQPAAAPVPLPDFTRWGDIERRPMSNIRRTTSQRLTHAWHAIPHVTQCDKADITAMEELRRKYREQVQKAGGNLTVTAMLVKVLATAVKQFPQFNASLDLETEEIVFKKYVNVGVAVDTERGLLVPVIRNADQKNITQIAIEVHQAAERARERKLTLEDMSGGGITISNLGGSGGTYFTPIVNWPEVAILGVSRGIIEPVWRSTTFEPRQLLPLSLSYDHRVIDGADAIRFLRWVVEAIEQPFLLSLLG